MALAAAAKNLCSVSCLVEGWFLHAYWTGLVPANKVVVPLAAQSLIGTVLAPGQSRGIHDAKKGAENCISSTAVPNRMAVTVAYDIFCEIGK